MKTCGKCKKEKPLIEYCKNRYNKKDGLSRVCRMCSREYIRQHYLAHKEYYIKKAFRDREKIKDYIRQQKNGPCVDCGMQYPYYVMDFDHKEGKKEFCLHVGWRYSLPKIKAEIKKCDLLCANCHRIRTQKRITSVAQLDE